MARPPKIILVAAIALIGGGFFLLAGAIALNDREQNRFVPVFLFSIGAWGIAAGVGVLRLKRWARSCVVLFAGLAAYLGTAVAPVILCFHMQLRSGAPGPTIGGRTIVFLLTLLQIAAGLWCAYVLMSNASRELFKVANAPRPFSLVIVGWYFVLSGFSEMLGIIRFMKFPRMLFGFVFTGMSAAVVSLSYIIIFFGLGIGLLRRKEQSRRLTIYFCVFELINILVFYLRPDREVAVQSFFNARALFDKSSATFLPIDALSFYLRLISIESLILSFLALWALASNKKEFVAGI